MSGMFLDIVAQHFLGGICRFSKTVGRLQSVSFFRSKPCLTSPAINRSKTGRIGPRPRQASWHQKIFAAHTHFAESVRQLRGRQIIEARKGRLQFGVTANGMNAVQCILRGVLQLNQREAEEAQIFASR